MRVVKYLVRVSFKKKERRCWQPVYWMVKYPYYHSPHFDLKFWAIDKIAICCVNLGEIRVPAKKQHKLIFPKWRDFRPIRWIRRIWQNHRDSITVSNKHSWLCGWLLSKLSGFNPWSSIWNVCQIYFLEVI